MIGTIEYNSATLYRYATVAAHELHNQLANDPNATAKTIREFARAFITSMPDGKQNTFANRTLPDAVMVAVRTDQPVNLVGAFEKAVASNDGYVRNSVQELARYAASIYTTFSCPPVKSFVIHEGLASLGETKTLQDMLSALEKEILDRIAPN